MIYFDIDIIKDFNKFMKNMCINTKLLEKISQYLIFFWLKINFYIILEHSYKSLYVL